MMDSKIFFCLKIYNKKGLKNINIKAVNVNLFKIKIYKVLKYSFFS